jgi:hypothetical protein
LECCAIRSSLHKPDARQQCLRDRNKVRIFPPRLIRNSAGEGRKWQLGIDDIEHGFVPATEFNSEKKTDICPPNTEQSRASFLALSPETSQVRDLFQTLIQHHVAITSTLPVMEAYSSDRPPPQQRVLDVMSPPAQAGYLSQRVLQPTSRSLKKEMELGRAFVKPGETLLTGPDPTGIGVVVAGFGDQREVELLVEAGFTPVEAIHIATENGARFLQEEDRIGTLAPTWWWFAEILHPKYLTSKPWRSSSRMG